MPAPLKPSPARQESEFIVASSIGLAFALLCLATASCTGFAPANHSVLHAGQQNPEPSKVTSSPTPTTTNQASSPASPSAPAASANASCLGAATWKDVRAAVCSTQGQFTFIDFSGSTFDSDGSFAAALYDSTGAKIATLTNGKLTPTENGPTIDFGADADGIPILTFRGVNFLKNPPSLGYDIIGGNSGMCAPLASGSVKSCLPVFEQGSQDSDDIHVPPAPTPAAP